MRDLARRITGSDGFASGVAMLIIANVFALILEAIPAFEHEHYDALEIFFWTSQALFVLEILLRLAAEPPRQFFADGWNRFDAAIVLASFVPVAGMLAPLGRLLRLLRVLRVLTAFRAMRDVVQTDHVAGPAIGPLSALLGLFMLIATLGGHILFRGLDLAHWDGLYASFRSVFLLMTLADGGIIRDATETSPASIVYFMAFYLSLIGIFLQVLTATLRPVAPEVRP